MGLAGILGEVNSAYHETLNGRELNQANRTNLLEMLKREWGIETQETYDLDKDLYWALLNLGITHMIKMCSAALEDLSAAEALYMAQSREDTGYLRYLIGLAHYQARDYDAALPNFLGAYSSYRQKATLNIYIGICFLNKTDPNVDMAVHYFEVAEALGYTLPDEIKQIICDHKKVSTRSGSS